MEPVPKIVQPGADSRRDSEVYAEDGPADRALYSEAWLAPPAPTRSKTAKGEAVSISIAEAVLRLEPGGLLKCAPRSLKRGHSFDPDRLIANVRELIGQDLPRDLQDFYHAGIWQIGSYGAVTATFSDWVDWRGGADYFTKYLELGAIEVFSDECGNPYVLDLTSGDQTPAVYFIDHEIDPPVLGFAAGSSLGACMLLIGEDERAFFAKEERPDRWELAIDPDIEKCPRAPALWNLKY